jgi:hypothetical protein
MEERQQWLSIGAVVLVILGLGFFLYRQSRQADTGQVEVISQEDQEADARGQEVADRLNVNIPENAERATLRNVADADGAGIATRVLEDEGDDEVSVLVALPDPQAGEFYAAYLVSGNEEDAPIYLGRLTQAKGGFMVEFNSSEEIGGYSMVRVTRESVDDEQPEEVLLEGEF